MDEYNEALEQLEVQQSQTETLKGKIPPADYDFYMEQFDGLKKLYRFNLMVSLIHYDLKCVVKTGLAADGKPEVLYFAKQMQVIARESFKTIFRFNKKSDYLKLYTSTISRDPRNMKY